jgi:Polysaccharide pyruvyl transferase
MHRVRDIECLANVFNRMREILLLNDTSGGEHWGCQAAGGSVLEASRSLEGVSRVSRYSVEYSWSFQPCPRNLEEARHMIGVDMPSLKEIRARVEAASLIVVNAEGTLLGNRNPVRNLLMFLLIAVETDTPFVVLNATIDPDAMGMSEESRTNLLALYRAVLPSAKLITVREARSYHNARYLGADTVWHVYDASLDVFRNVDSHSTPAGSNECTVFGSVLLNRERSPRLRKFLSWFQESLGCDLTLCAMTKQERPFLLALSQELDCAFEDYDSLDLGGVCKLVDDSRVTISGRYHGCLLSAARGIPFVHYETHSNRINDFTRHLCYEDACVRIFHDGHRGGEWENALGIWNDRLGRRDFLEDQIPFISEKSKLHRRLLHDVWRDMEGDVKAASREGYAISEPFISRASIASGLLTPGMSVVDFGGYKQIFGEFYEFSSYLSIDLIFSRQEEPLGQPVNALRLEDLPFPDFHHEVDIDSIQDFTFIENYEVAVFLGVLPWLKNWMETLQAVAGSGVSQMLISWDEYELDRVSAIMGRKGFRESCRVKLNSKSSISHFVKAL